MDCASTNTKNFISPRIKAAFLSTAAAFAIGCAANQSAMNQHSIEAPELLLTGGTVLTMDAARPRAEAVFVRQGRVVAVGGSKELRAMASSRARVVELSGRTLIPGLVDGHCHLFGLGHSLEILSLRGLKSPEAVLELVSKSASARPSGEWITGRGWDQNLWSPPVFPSHSALDSASEKHPIALRRIDGHALWSNRVAIRLAGITKETPDPPGGTIVRDSNGEPTGIFIDRAMELIESKIPPDSGEALERKILAAADKALSLGITGVHEMGIESATIEAYRRLNAQGRLGLRVYAYASGESHAKDFSAWKPDRDADGTAMFVLRGVKFFADGALGSRGAALLSPYSDAAESSGLVLMPEADLKAAALRALKSGFQVAVHAIGDRANRMVLNAFEQAFLEIPSSSNVGDFDPRFRVEHAQIVDPSDLNRFAKLGVIASMQPTHATSDMAWAKARLGPERLIGAYAWKSLLSSGAHIVFGSDFPVEEMSPMLGLYAAVTRQDSDGNPPLGFVPEQRISLEDALRMFTAEPAYASFTEAHRGKIAKGFVADFTVFEGDLRPDKSLLSLPVDFTIIGGRVVYERRP